MKNDIPKVSFRKPEKDAFEFEVFTLKHLFSRSDGLHPPIEHPHRLGFYQILYFTRGRGRHYIDFKPYECSRGSLLFVSAGQVHAFEVNPENDGFLLLFTENFLTENMIHSDIFSFSRLFNYHLYSPVIPPLDTSESFFTPVINEIYNEYIFADTWHIPVRQERRHK